MIKLLEKLCSIGCHSGDESDDEYESAEENGDQEQQMDDQMEQNVVDIDQSDSFIWNLILNTILKILLESSTVITHYMNVPR